MESDIHCYNKKHQAKHRVTSTHINLQIYTMYLHYVSSRSTSDRLPGNESPLLNPKSKMNGEKEERKKTS